MRKELLILLLVLCALKTDAQDTEPAKFGKISPQDFQVAPIQTDSDASAIIISDVGHSKFTGNNSGWFTLLYTRHTRIFIRDARGIDAATVKIPLYYNKDSKEKISSLKAYTYNLTDGKVEEIKMPSDAVFETKENNHWMSEKFSLPSVKAGSIIEYTYTISSEFLFNLQPWEFQGAYPIRYSEYGIEIPSFFRYVFLSQGYLKFDEDKSSTRNESFVVRQRNETTAQTEAFALRADVAERTWVIKNSPAIKEEKFTSTINNHITKVEFQLSEYDFPGQAPEQVMGTWQQLGEKLLGRQDFGSAYLNPNPWLNQDLKAITQGAKDDLEKAKRIYAYVRDNFTCSSYYGIYLSDNTSVKDVFKRRSGTVSDLNLLLTAMMRQASIQADPVILSQRSRGVVHAIYPLIDRFNYLISKIKIDTTEYLLDASRPMLGFDHLMPESYNGTAWVVTLNPYAIDIPAEALKENNQTSVFIINKEGGGLIGSFQTTCGDVESYALRQRMIKESRASLLEEIQKSLATGMTASNLLIDSLGLIDEPVKETFDFTMDAGNDDLIYFKPMLNQALAKNPFVSSTRLYPVEMPFLTHDVYVLTMETPKGYMVDELPKSVRFRLNGDEGLFECIFSKSTDKIQMVSKLFLNKATFQPGDYSSLRDFFSMVIQKEGEPIVFKKIK